MKLFLEVYKKQTREEVEKGVPQEMVRVEVDTEDTEVLKKKAQDIANNMGWTEYEAYLHKCYHDEGTGKPCELIKLV